YCVGSDATDGPAIYSVHSETQSMDQHIELNAPADFFGQLAFDDVNDRLLVQLPGGIYTIQPGSGELSNTPLIDLSQTQYVYSLEAAPGSGDIYIGDALDFSSSGEVYIYYSDGQPKGSFSVGIGPNNFYFE